MYTLSLILLHILTLYDFYSTAQLDQRFLRSMNSFHMQEHHLHSISALFCLKTRDLFAVSISKSSLTCTIAQLHCCLHSFTFCVCIEVLCTALLYTTSLCTVLLCTTSLCTALLCTLDSVHWVWCLSLPCADRNLVFSSVQFDFVFVIHQQCNSCFRNR